MLQRKNVMFPHRCQSNRIIVGILICIRILWCLINLRIRLKDIIPASIIIMLTLKIIIFIQMIYQVLQKTRHHLINKISISKIILELIINSITKISKILINHIFHMKRLLILKGPIYTINKIRFQNLDWVNGIEELFIKLIHASVSLRI